MSNIRFYGLYYNKIKKYDAWVSIAEVMACETTEVKKKMESLLASFRREKLKGTKTIGTGKGRHEVYESKWFAFRRLAFLLDRDEPTQTINSIEGDKEDEEEIEETDISEVAGPEIDTLELQHEAQKETNDTSQKRIIPTENQISISKKPKTISKMKKNKEEKDSRVDEAFLLLKSTAEKKKNDLYDDYGIYIANKLKTYSARTKAFVQYHFNSILFQADMGQFEVSHHSSTPVPTPSPTFTLTPMPPYSPTSTPASTSTIISVPLPSPQTDQIHTIDCQNQTHSANDTLTDTIHIHLPNQDQPKNSEDQSGTTFHSVTNFFKNWPHENYE
nr:unnamed protein product [Callosobruchus chinensis]